MKSRITITIDAEFQKPLEVDVALRDLVYKMNHWKEWIEEEKTNTVVYKIKGVDNISRE